MASFCSALFFCYFVLYFLVTFLVSGLSFLVSGFWLWFCSLFSGFWLLVSGLWSLVSGLWSVVCDLWSWFWFLISRFWTLVLFAVFWFLVLALGFKMIAWAMDEGMGRRRRRGTEGCFRFQVPWLSLCVDLLEFFFAVFGDPGHRFWALLGFC